VIAHTIEAPLFAVWQSEHRAIEKPTGSRSPNYTFGGQKPSPTHDVLQRPLRVIERE